MSDYDKCVREGVIRPGDDFTTRKETNVLLGLSPTAGFMRGGARIAAVDGEAAIIWWPKCRDEKNGWENVKEEYGEDIGRGFNSVLVISEKNLDERRNQEHIQRVIATSAERIRYVFWREELNRTRWYKFYGKFQLDEEATRRENKCIFKRIVSEVAVNCTRHRG